LPQAAQLFLTESAFSQKFSEDERELRVPAVVLANRLEKTIEADLYVDQTEGESGILYAVKKTSSVASYEVTV